MNDNINQLNENFETYQEILKNDRDYQNSIDINYSEDKYIKEDMINFAEFVATYQDKNKNYKGEMLHAKSKYDGAERTIDLLEIWFEQIKKK